VLLERVTLAGNVGGDLHAVGEADAGDLANSGVRLPRRLGGHLGTDAALEGRRIIGRTIRERIKAARERYDFGLATLVATTLLGELIDGHLFRKPAMAGCENYI